MFEPIKLLQTSIDRKCDKEILKLRHLDFNVLKFFYYYLLI